MQHTKAGAVASDELSTFLLFLFSPIYNLSPDKTKVSGYLYKFTQILSDYLRISGMTERDQRFSILN